MQHNIKSLFLHLVSKQTCYFGVIACEVLFHVTAHLPYIKLLNEGNNKKDNPIGVSKVWFAEMQGVSHPLVYMSLPQLNFSFLMRTSTHTHTKTHTPLALHNIYSTQCRANVTQIWNLTFTKGDTIYSTERLSGSVPFSWTQRAPLFQDENYVN